MKRVTKAVCSLVVGGALMLGSALAQTTFRVADNHADGYPTVEALKYMGDVLSKETDGRLSFQIFHSSQLGDEKDALQLVQFGVIDILRVHVALLNNMIPETRVLTMPYLFRSNAHFHGVVDGAVGDEFLSYLEPYGLIGLAMYDNGQRSIYNSARPIENLADMKGLKIRVQQSDIQVAMIAAMGANPTPMPFGEVYSALQTGMVDGAENNWPSYESARHFEQAQYFSLTEHINAPEIVVMSRKVWDKLSPEDQRLIRAAAKASVPKMRALWDAREKRAEDAVRQSGVQVNAVDKAAFRDAMKPVYDAFVRDEKLKKLVEKVQSVE